jgi:hypothetical protein
MMPPKYTLEGCGDPEPVNEGDVQMEYSYDYLYSPSIGTVTKNYL